MIQGFSLLSRARLARAGLSLLLALLPGLSGTSRADLVLNELMAVADEDRRDEDGAPSDWLEIVNTGSQRESLRGYYLTNNRNDLTRWEFPDVSMAAGSYLVVYASAKDRTGQELHTSFTLDRGGDYLALVAPDGHPFWKQLATEGLPSPGLPARRVTLPRHLGSRRL